MPGIPQSNDSVEPMLLKSSLSIHVRLATRNSQLKKNSNKIWMLELKWWDYLMYVQEGQGLKD